MSKSFPASCLKSLERELRSFPATASLQFRFRNIYFENKIVFVTFVSKQKMMQDNLVNNVPNLRFIFTFLAENIVIIGYFFAPQIKLSM